MLSKIVAWLKAFFADDPATHGDKPPFGNPPDDSDTTSYVDR